MITSDKTIKHVIGSEKLIMYEIFYRKISKIILSWKKLSIYWYKIFNMIYVTWLMYGWCKYKSTNQYSSYNKNCNEINHFNSFY